MKKKILPVLLLLIVALSGWYFYNKEQTNTHPEQITLYGNVDIREVKLSFNGSEHIRKILVHEGDSVKKGQELASLHSEILQAQSAQAKALVEAQRQVLAALVAGTRSEEIDQARADLEAAKAKLVSAQSTAERLSKLAAKKMASADEAENSRALARADAAQVKALESALALAIAGPRKEDIAQARAILLARQAEYVRSQQQLKNAILYAPSDGIIRNRILEEGDMASPQTPVLTLALTNPVWIRAYLSETQLGQVKPGMKATIHTDSFPGKNYSGWAGYISPTAEFTPKNIETPELRSHLVYQIRIYSCNEDNELRLGMPSTVTINLQQTAPSEPQKINRCSKNTVSGSGK